METQDVFMYLIFELALLLKKSLNYMKRKTGLEIQLKFLINFECNQKYILHNTAVKHSYF